MTPATSGKNNSKSSIDTISMPPPRDEAVALFLPIIHFALFNLHNSK
jgi:hypothetical protein